MIKVNLARPESMPMEEGASVSSGLSFNLSSLSGNLEGNSLIKVAMIFILPLGLYLWEARGLKSFRQQYNTKSAELETLRDEVSQYGSAAVAIEEMQRERKALQDRIHVIKKIASKRTFKIRTLADLQKNIPGDCWLKEIKISKNSVNLQGYSRSATSVQSLVEKLGQSPFLSEVVNEGMTQKTFGENTVSEFNIVAQVKGY